MIHTNIVMSSSRFMLTCQHNSIVFSWLVTSAYYITLAQDLDKVRYGFIWADSSNLQPLNS